MPYKDMREFMEFLKKRGELNVCQKEVSAKIEIARITDKSSKAYGPAILFENVKGFKNPVVTGLFGNYDRCFLAIDTNKYDGFKKMAHGLENPIPTRLLKDGPCKEVIKVGKDINLLDIPVLWHHQKDSHFFVTTDNARVKDPDTGIYNSSINRLAVQGKDIFSVQTNLPHQMGIIAKKYLDKGKPCPVAMAIGTDPAIAVSSSASLSAGVDEFEFAGGMRGKPVEVIKCDTNDLEVPATSELVIEGEFRPGNEEGKIGKTDYADDAPFAEFHGYFGKQARNPVIHVTAITHRKDYIYHGLGTAEPPSEHQLLGAIGMMAEYYSILKTLMPKENIVAINPMVSSAGLGAVISIKKTYGGQGKQLIYSIIPRGTIKSVIIVDEDIDVFNWLEVDWAVQFRAGGDDYIITKELPGQGIDPIVTIPPNLMKKVGIDATLPLNGDKPGRVDILRELGASRYVGLKEINLNDYLEK